MKNVHCPQFGHDVLYVWFDLAHASARPENISANNRTLGMGKLERASSGQNFEVVAAIGRAKHDLFAKARWHVTIQG